MPKNIAKKSKISGPNGWSKCPESREMDFGPFRGKYVSAIFRRFFGPTFFEKMNLKGSSEGVTQVKKGSYIDPLAMRFSPKSELLIGNFHQNFSVLVKPYLLFLQYRKSVLKKAQISGPNFEPCSSCVDVYVFSEKMISGKQRPP